MMRTKPPTSVTAVPMLVAGLLAGGSVVAVSFALTKMGLPSGARWGVALLPTPLYAWLEILIVRGVRRMDEMQRQVHGEAAAWSLAITAVATTCYGHLQWAGAPALNWSYVWVLITALYSAGYLVVQRHYR